MTLADIPKQIEFVDRDIRQVGNVKMTMFDQPTNGISYVRVKANLNNLPQHLRLFVPMFSEFLSRIGTKNYAYDVFDNKLHSVSSGLDVSIDRYAPGDDHSDIHARKEQLLISTGFLDRNIDKAFECLQEVLATPT